MPKVSIIIPVYNVEQYLRKCLDSVVNQTLKDIEIICIDDGSKDRSGIILDEYTMKDSRIKVIHKENGGYGKAMNVGIDCASGEYIGIVESDDYIESDMYEKLYYAASTNNVDIAKANYYKFYDDDIWLVPLTTNKSMYNKILNPQEDLRLFKISMYNWAGIYKTQFIREKNIRHNETPGASYQDTGFHFQIFSQANSCYLLDDYFYFYRQDNPNASIKNTRNIDVTKIECDFVYDFIQSHPEVKLKFMQPFYLRKFMTYLFTFSRLDKDLKKKFLPIFRNEFVIPFLNNEIDKNFLEGNYNLISLLVNNPSKFYRKMSNTLTLAQKIFTIKNENLRKVIFILGIKFKFKSKKLEERERYRKINSKIDILNYKFHKLEKELNNKKLSVD